MSDPRDWTPPLDRIPFSSDDESSMLSMVKWMRISAVLALVAAGFNLVAVFTAAQLGNLISVPIQVLLAVWLLSAAKRFGLVATTDDADQHHLAQGIGDLRNIFLLKSVLLIVGLVLAAVAIVGAFVVAGMGMANAGA